MRFPTGWILTACRELLQGTLTDRLEHRVARLAAHCLLLLRQALVHQGLQAVERVQLARAVCHAGRLQRKAADEDPQPSEQRPLVYLEQVVAPFNRAT